MLHMKIIFNERKAFEGIMSSKRSHIRESYFVQNYLMVVHEWRYVLHGPFSVKEVIQWTISVKEVTPWNHMRWKKSLHGTIFSERSYSMEPSSVKEVTSWNHIQGNKSLHGNIFSEWSHSMEPYSVKYCKSLQEIIVSERSHSMEPYSVKEVTLYIEQYSVKEVTSFDVPKTHLRKS